MNQKRKSAGVEEGRTRKLSKQTDISSSTILSQIYIFWGKILKQKKRYKY